MAGSRTVESIWRLRELYRLWIESDEPPNDRDAVPEFVWRCNASAVSPAAATTTVLWLSIATAQWVELSWLWRIRGADSTKRLRI